jgi:hypothetical protein
MWSDNETEVDYLGFDDLVAQVLDIVDQPHLLPVTIGVFGDWGSGKSSLMAMARAALRANERVVTVSFSPWQHEDYDDVKTALILAVMAALEGKRSPLEKLGGATKTRALQILDRLRKRVNVLRTLSWVVKGGSAALLAAHGDQTLATMFGASALGDLGSSIKPKEVADGVASGLDKAANLVGDGEDAVEPIEQGIGRFRRDFEELLKTLDIDALVVFIDDLDRCLPENVVDTLEAVRLFLAVPKTAFVIGADERIVRHAIGRRYPELATQPADTVRGLDIGRDYLEKMIQIPVRIPALTAIETETYLNLLGVESYAGDGDLAKAVAANSANRQRRLSIPFDHGVAQKALGTLAPDLDDHMALVARIAPILASGHSGNPRQIKRFFNTLLLRQRLAERRGITLKSDVLAKLMLLEYFQTAQFRELFRWHLAAPGPVPELGSLETAVDIQLAPAKKKDDGEDLDADLRRWLEEPALKAWLALEPKLAREDLEPYFHYSRDRLTGTAPTTRRLQPELQQLLVGLFSDSDTVRDTAQKELLRLEEADLRAVYDALAAAFVRDPRRLDNKLGRLLVAVAVARSILVPELASALGAAPATAIQPALALSLRTSFKPLPAELRRVLQRWAEAQDGQLVTAAKQALAKS